MVSSAGLPVHLRRKGDIIREPAYLPVDDVLPALASHLAGARRVVLSAPPGAGKTTRVPLALLDEAWLGGQRIVMLEPRRLAARAAAGFMARRLGEAVGETVGYRVRMDARVGPRTRVEVVTEGVLTRMLQQDPALDGVGLVIFDEFHERSIHADLGLALALQSQALLRPELRIVIMSATLDEAGVATLLHDAPVVRSEGRVHPVTTTYLDRRVDGPMEAATASAVLRALDNHDGDVLAFLPGAAEIRRTAQRLDGAALPPGASVMPLYGDLPHDAQDRAIAPSPPGSRKVVLATAIAETSLTIEGVRVVIDSGLMRVPRFSPRTGMTRLVTVPVSRASADQRRGRAGRLGPGFCYRLWTAAEDAGLLAYRPPEILEADLAGLALELAAWGVSDPLELRWIDAPPLAAFAQARELLTDLDALDDAGRITQHGRAMASLPMHPRLAHMLTTATLLEDAGAGDDAGAEGAAAAGHPCDGLARVACDLAALLAERDILRAQDGTADPDLLVRLALMRGERATPLGHTVDHGALRRAQAESRHWLRRLRRGGVRPSGDPDTADDPATADDRAGVLLALAYPDRIGQRRGGRGRFLLRNGRGAAIDPHHNLAAAEAIVAADVGGHGRDSRIFLAAPITRADIEHHFGHRIRTEQVVGWDAVARSVQAREVRRLGALILADRPLADVPPERIAEAWLAAVRAEGLDMLDWTDDAQRLRQRLAFLHALAPGDWPDVSDSALLDSLETWLLPWIGAGTDGPGRGGDPGRAPGGAGAGQALRGVDPGRALRGVNPGHALLGAVGHQRRAELDRLAPTHVEVPSGSRIPIDYADPAAPVLAVRLQEMFGLADTPRIADGRVPLTLHLLSPARRPVQVTRDLASFWSSGYFEVRRDLRGRYPRHYWPDDPLQAEATHRTRPRPGTGPR
jgi:ATP-dependent helicase HrpB